MKFGLGDLIITPSWKKGPNDEVLISVGMIKEIEFNERDKEIIYVTHFPLEKVTDCIPGSELEKYVESGEWKVRYTNGR